MLTAFKNTYKNLASPEILNVIYRLDTLNMFGGLDDENGTFDK